MKSDIKTDCRVTNNRTSCLACGAALPATPLMHFDNMPATAQNIPDAEEIAEDHGISLFLYRCPKCGLVQFNCEPVSYYSEVIRAVGLSETMKELRRRDYRHLVEDYGLFGKKFIECGCGRGEFLEVLKEFPVRIYGTEADKTNADIAHFSLNRCEGCGSFNAYLDEKAAGQQAKNIGICEIRNVFPDRADMEIAGAPFDCFLSFNFLEHQPDPRAMLGCMYHNLSEGGYGLITVPSFEYIAKEGNYYEFIRDHIANYTLSSLRALCESCGFTVLEEGFIGIGDTLRMIVQKQGKKLGGFISSESERKETAVLIEKTSGFTKIEAKAPKLEAALKEKGERRQETENAPQGECCLKLSVFGENYRKKQADIAAYIDDLKKKGRRLALWGAGHQGFTIAATTALKDYACYIIDSADFKQGRYAPASHIPIVSPARFEEDPVDVIMIAAPGYIKEIETSIRERFSEKHPELKICDVLNLWER